MNISINTNYLDKFINDIDFHYIATDVINAHHSLHNHTCINSDLLGWLDYNIDPKLLNIINEKANEIVQNSDVLIVIGAGGSYCGAKAVIDSLCSQFYNDITNRPKIYFVGHNLSSQYLNTLIKICDKGNVTVNVISKSGSTLEPSLAFRIFKEYLEKRYGNIEACKRIICTTDATNGILRNLAIEYNYTTFEIPNDIGGRYSVITPVGLLPMAVAGIDIYKLTHGFNTAVKELSKIDLNENPCYKYAAVRNILYNKGKLIELAAFFDPSMQTMTEWFRQLFAESEGKNGKGIFPDGVCYTRDLHSVGQYIQQGNPIIFETFFTFDDYDTSITIPFNLDNLDDLNNLSGVNLNTLNNYCFQSVFKAHYDGNVPVMNLSLPKFDEFNMGYLIYFLEKSCAMSGILLGINPFNQPGVEVYKQNMHNLITAK